MNRVVSFLVLIVALGATSCSDGNYGDARVSVAVSALNASDVTQVTITVDGPGMATVTEDLVLVGSTWPGTIGQLPAGTGRTFVGEAFGVSHNLLFRGTATGVSITGVLKVSG